MKLWYQLLSSETGMKNFIAATQGLCDRAASPGTTVDVRGTTEGALGDQFRLFWHYDVREVIGNALRIRKEGGYDAFVLANSLDPALVELREMLDIPVVSFMEVSCFVACMMGEKFGLVAPNRKMIARYREIPIGYGLRDRLAAVESLDFDNIRGFNDAFTDQELGDACVAQILAASERCIAQGAEVVIPTGPSAALLATRGVFTLGKVPLLDGYSLLVKASEMMVSMHKLTGVHVSRHLLYEAPSEEYIQRVAGVRNIAALKAGKS